MDEIIAKILAMRSITLSKSEWELVKLILGKLTDRSPEAFKSTLTLWQSLDQSAKFDEWRLDSFLSYLSQWQEITILLGRKIEQISAVWENTFFTPISGGDLLATLVELINCEDLVLGTLSYKIETAVKLLPATTPDDDPYPFELTCLYAAVEAKINPATNLSEEGKREHEDECKKIETIRGQLGNAHEEVKRQLQLRQITTDLKESKASLIEKIKTKLLKENKSFFEPKFTNAKNIDDLILDIIKDDNALQTSGLKPISNPDILLLFEKFKEILDLSAEVKTDEFNKNKNIFLVKLKDALLNENKSYFEPKFENAKNIDALVLDIIKDNNALKKSDLKPIASSSTLLLLDKFKAVYDLSVTCREGQRRTSENKIEELSAKYSLYENILNADGDQTGTKILKTLTLFVVFEKIYKLLPPSIRPRTTEERLMAGLLFKPVKPLKPVLEIEGGTEMKLITNGVSNSLLQVSGEGSRRADEGKEISPSPPMY